MQLNRCFRPEIVVLLVVLQYLIVNVNAFNLPSFFSSGSTTKTSKEIPKEIKMPESDKRYYWDLSKVAFSFLPLYPGSRRKTAFAEVVPGQIWTLDQLQGIISVNVPVRAVVVRLKKGGLLVYNPIGPTAEAIDYIKSLVQKYGAVKYILLATVGLEHKGFLGPFSRYFPLAEVWVQRGQWSFPINLPGPFLGFPFDGRTNIIPENDVLCPWKDDFGTAVLGPLRFKSVGAFGETALFHYATRTLLVTDSVVNVNAKPSPILTEDPRALLYHSRDSALDKVEDTEEARIRGWRRLALFGLTFFPSAIEVMPPGTAFQQGQSMSNTSALLGKGMVPFDGRLYPWTWNKPIQEAKSFQALTKNRLLVAPILRVLILNREPERVLTWAKQIAQWDFKRVIPAHLEGNVQAGRQDFLQAFSFLQPPSKQQQKNKQKSGGEDILEEDLFLLRTLSKVFTRLGVVAPPAI